ncbi:MAG: S-layer homology domain-containing protein [Oscillospiraceae bacterium]
MKKMKKRMLSGLLAFALLLAAPIWTVEAKAAEQLLNTKKLTAEIARAYLDVVQEQAGSWGYTTSTSIMAGDTSGNGFAGGVLKDFDRNGVPELYIVRTDSLSDAPSTYAYEQVWTWNGSKAVLLFENDLYAYGSRDLNSTSLHTVNGITYFHDGGGGYPGAGSGYCEWGTIYRLQNGAWKEVLTYSYQEPQEYDENFQLKEVPPVISVTENGAQRTCSETEYRKLLKRYTADDPIQLVTEGAGCMGLLFEPNGKELCSALETKALSGADAQTLLSRVAYLGDRTKCKMDAKMAAGYAQVLAKMPATFRDEWGYSGELKALLLDPAGDGMPLMLTAYAGEYGDLIYAYSTGKDVTFWTWDGKQAKAFDFDKDLESGFTFGYGFGKKDGKNVLSVGDGCSLSVGDMSGSLTYEVSNAQLTLLDHFMFYSAWSDDGVTAQGARLPLVNARKDEWGYEASVDELLRAGWTADWADEGVIHSLSLYLHNGEPASQSAWEEDNLDEWYSGFEFAEVSTGGSYLMGDWSAGADAAALLQQYADAYGRPSYTYEEVTDALTADQVAAIAAAIAERLGGELGEIYRLSDDLYYVVIYVDGAVSGGALVKQTKTGFRVVSADSGEAAAQEALDAALRADQTTSNLTFDYSKLGEEPLTYLKNVLAQMDGTAPNDAAKGELATFLETVLTQQSAYGVSAKKNQIVIDGGAVEQSLSQAQEFRTRYEQVLTDEGITLNKTVTLILRIVCRDLEDGKPVQITFDKSVLEQMGQADGVQVLLGDASHGVRLTKAALSALLERYAAVVVQLNRTGDNTWQINFLDDAGQVVDQLEQSVFFLLPADSELATVLATYSGGSDNWGGQYDRANGALEFSTKFSGVYEIVRNEVALNDIGDLDEDVQKAIRFMVSKGYFTADGGNFDPNGPLKRYDFTAALVGMFFALDRSLTTTFPDVPADSPFYAHVASAQHDNIVQGYDDGTFSGDNLITREQVLALAARTLAEKKGYAMPADPETYLDIYSDGSDTSDWAVDTMALAIREGLLPAELTALEPLREITRAEAADILYRLFMLLYEVSPAPIEMEEIPQESASFPVVPVVIGAGAAVVLAAAGGVFVLKKKKK